MHDHATMERFHCSKLKAVRFLSYESCGWCSQWHCVWPVVQGWSIAFVTAWQGTAVVAAAIRRRAPAMQLGATSVIRAVLLWLHPSDALCWCKVACPMCVGQIWTPPKIHWSYATSNGCIPFPHLCLVVLQTLLKRWRSMWGTRWIGAPQNIPCASHTTPIGWRIPAWNVEMQGRGHTKFMVAVNPCATCLSGMQVCPRRDWPSTWLDWWLLPMNPL